jgi:hypothetical protein
MQKRMDYERDTLTENLLHLYDALVKPCGWNRAGRPRPYTPSFTPFCHCVFEPQPVLESLSYRILPQNLGGRLSYRSEYPQNLGEKHSYQYESAPPKFWSICRVRNSRRLGWRAFVECKIRPNLGGEYLYPTKSVPTWAAAICSLQMLANQVFEHLYPTKSVPTWAAAICSLQMASRPNFLTN